jgi:intracellular septation protein
MLLKLITEFGPLAAFFIGYQIDGIMTATLYTIIASIIAVIVFFIVERKIHKANAFSTVILCLSGGMTLFSGDASFIKMKPTILYILFASVFFITNFKWQPAAKYFFSAINLKDDSYWAVLNYRLMWFFIFMAIANELIWRNFPEEFWVNFKIFGTPSLVFGFIFTQMPFITRNIELNSSEIK